MKKILKNTFIDKDGKIIRTTTMMFSSYFIAAVMAVYELYKSGFDYNVFLAYLSIAGASKIIDGIHTKLGKDDNVPADAK